MRFGKEQKVAAAIGPLLLDQDPDVGLAALFVIGMFGADADMATPQLQRVLLTGDVFSPHLGAHVFAPDIACEAISRIGPGAAQAIQQMIQVIQTPPAGHGLSPSACVRALGKMGNTQPDVISTLLATLKSSDINMRNGAASALSTLPIWSEEIQGSLQRAVQREPDSVELEDALETVRSRRSR